MNINKFDLFLAEFPFTDLSGTKLRPVLILKNIEGNNAIVCQITKQRHNLRKYEIPLKKEDCNEALRVDSFIYVDILTTLHKRVLTKRLGSISNQNIRSEVEAKLKLLLFD